jgi:hypothetical protein
MLKLFQSWMPLHITNVYLKQVVILASLANHGQEYITLLSMYYIQ